MGTVEVIKNCLEVELFGGVYYKFPNNKLEVGNFSSGVYWLHIIYRL